MNIETSVRSLPEVVKESIAPLLKIATKKNLYLKTEILEKNIQVEIDQLLFRDAIFQVVDNGIKFTKKGGVLVQIATQRVNEQLKAMIKVIDTGVGIQNDDIQKVFGEFRQASEGLNRAFEGLGVGLNLAKKIVEMMNGEITIESETGKGSVVTILLPIKMDEKRITEEIAVRKRTTMFESTLSKTLDQPSVLLVEDNPLNRDVMKIYLKNKYNVTEACDGISALVMAGQTNFDIVLMDINLGEGIDGIETMKRLRALDHYKKIPIIAITAYVLAGDKERFLEQGFDNYLAKPFTREMLAKMLEKVSR
jgi:CheY-like chemotaxis protein